MALELTAERQPCVLFESTSLSFEIFKPRTFLLTIYISVLLFCLYLYPHIALSSVVFTIYLSPRMVRLFGFPTPESSSEYSSIIPSSSLNMQPDTRHNGLPSWRTNESFAFRIVDGRIVPALDDAPTLNLINKTGVTEGRGRDVSSRPFHRRTSSLPPNLSRKKEADDSSTSSRRGPLESLAAKLIAPGSEESDTFELEQANESHNTTASSYIATQKGRSGYIKKRLSNRTDYSVDSAIGLSERPNVDNGLEEFVDEFIDENGVDYSESFVNELHGILDGQQATHLVNLQLKATSSIRKEKNVRIVHICDLCEEPRVRIFMTL